MHLVIIHGTVRKGQHSEHVTAFVKDAANEQADIEQVTVVDPRKLDLSFDDEGGGASSEELTRIMSEADGYVIVVPEYNHGYPGSLKYLLDLNLQAYIHKPVSLVSVSAGLFGGTRVIENLLPVLRHLGMTICFTDMNVSNVQNYFGNGELKERETWERRLNSLFEELAFMMKTMKYGRETYFSKYHKES